MSTNLEKLAAKVMGAGCLIVALWFTLWLSVVGTVLYVAYHFISKYW
jgi:hypothetical protein